jgi:hypothetical protein
LLIAACVSNIERLSAAAKRWPTGSRISNNDIAQARQFKEYGRALEWGYPQGVGWRPLDLFQTHYLMNLGGVEAALVSLVPGGDLEMRVLDPGCWILDGRSRLRQ